MADPKTQTFSGLSSIAAPVNPAGLSAQDLGDYGDALEQAKSALEARYAAPNYFNIAAGFLKPQLGGFAASLGSASQAMGDTIEQQRANVAPVAQLRAEIVRAQLMQKQKGAANEVIKAHDPAKAYSSDELRQLAQLDPGGPGITSAAAANAELTRSEQERQTRASTTNTALSNQAVLASQPWLAGIQDDVSGISKKSPEEQQTVINRLDKSRPASVDTITWAGMQPNQKVDSISSNASSQLEAGNKEEYAARDRAIAARDMNPKLLELRALVTGDGPNDPNALAPLLGKFQGNTLIDLVASEVNKNGLANGGYGKDIAEALGKLNASPEQINRFQLLVKGLAAMQADKRDSAMNPTNLFQQLQQQGSPTILNGANAMVRMFDLAALNGRKEQDSYAARVDNGIDARHLDTTKGDLASIAKNHGLLSKQIALTDPTNEKTAPAFYTTPTFWDGKKVTGNPQSLLPETPASKFEEGKIYTDAKGNKAQYVNGQWKEIK